MPLTTNSTPGRPSTARVRSEVGENPTTDDQDTIKKKIADELGPQIWQFEAKRIAQMLSRKSRKPGIRPWKEGDIDRLSNYNFDIDHDHYTLHAPQALRKFKALAAEIAWPESGSGEEHFYGPVAKLLTACIQSWQTTLPDNDQRLYGLLKFVDYPRNPVQDRVKGAVGNLKPDIAGIIHPDKRPPTWWNPTKEGLAQVQLPVEVKNDNKQMFNQAASYARCLFNTSPFRQFALALAFNHATNELTFLICHRGGQTRSYPLLIHSSETALEQLHGIFLALMTWETREDAGIPLLFNGIDIYLPLMKSDTNGFPFRVCETLSSKNCIRGRANHVFRVSGDPTALRRPYPLFCTTSAASRNASKKERRKARTTLLQTAPHVGIAPFPSATIRPQPATGSQTGKPKRKLEEVFSMQETAHEEKESQQVSGDHKRPRTRAWGRLQAESKTGQSREQEGTSSMGSRHLHGEGANVTSGETAPATVFGVYTMEDTPEEEALRRIQPAEFVKPRVYRGKKRAVLSRNNYLIVKYSCNEDRDGNSRCVEANVMDKCAGIFGTAGYHCSFSICNQAGNVMSNHIFLPSPDESDEEKAEAHVYTDKKGVPKPEYRSPWLHVSDFAGTSLITANNPRLLFIAIFHSMLGWLGMLYRLFLHRDISIGNLLMTVTAVLLEEFDVHHQEKDWEAEYRHMGLGDEPTREEVDRQVKKLEEIVGSLGISKECYGCVIDGDMVCDLETYWDSLHDGQRSGTEEFMFNELLEAIQEDKPYLHSPVDDLFSFYYVCQWAAVFHETPQPLEALEKLQDKISANHDKRAAATSEKIASEWKVLDEESYGPFLAKCQPALRQWYASINKLRGRWERLHSGAKKKTFSKDQEKSFYIRNFIVFAREGVKNIGEILMDNLANLSSYKDPTNPPETEESA